MINPSAPATRKQQQTRELSEALRSFVLEYKGWMEEALRREKLTLPQLRLLRAVEEGQGQSAASLARTCMVTPQTFQSMLQRAVREQWIHRSPSAANGRVLTSTLTAKGEAVLAHGKALAAQFESQIWAGVGESTVQQCADILKRGVANMERARPADVERSSPQRARPKR